MVGLLTHRIGGETTEERLSAVRRIFVAVVFLFIFLLLVGVKLLFKFCFHEMFTLFPSHHLSLAALVGSNLEAERWPHGRVFSYVA